MDSLNLNLSSLKDKVASKLAGENVVNQNKKKALEKKRAAQKEVNIKKEEELKKISDLKKEAAIKKREDQRGDSKMRADSGRSDFEKSAKQGKKNDFKKGVKGPEDRKTESPKLNDLEVLRQEALTLGGSEKDLDLIKEVVSAEESEQEFSDAEVSQELNQEVGDFIKKMGLEGVMQKEEEEKEEENKEKENKEEEIIPEKVQEIQLNQEEKKAKKEKKNKQKDNQEKEKETKQETGEPLRESSKIENLSTVNSDKLIIPPQREWYNVPIQLSDPSAKVDSDQVERLFARGKECLDQENQIYFEEFNSNHSQKKFMSEVLTGGTLSDKISALTLLIQEAPLHNVKLLETLLGMCEKKSRTAALQSVNAMKDLLLNGLLPDRKLRSFSKQPLSGMLTRKQLGLFYFEHLLKDLYFKFIGILERLLQDPITHVRMTTLSHVFDLLKAKPEQEVNLLRLGVNKLGDIDNKVSAKASYQVLLLEQQHPMMKQIVVDAVTDVIFRQNNDYHATYYSVVALNQTILTKREPEVSNKLVQTYFALFEKLLVESDKRGETVTKQVRKSVSRKKRAPKRGKKGGISVKSEKTDGEIVEEKSAKLFSALVTGLNRAFPFCELESKVFEAHLNTLFKITHSCNFNTSVQALVLIHHIVEKSKVGSDRYFRTLYESLFDERLLTSSKQGIYLNLLFKSLKQDLSITRVCAFVKRISQVCLNWLHVGTISGMIFLLIQLQKEKPALANLVLNAPVDDLYKGDSEEEHFEDAPEVAVEQQSLSVEKYDPRQRDPRFANAEKSSLWEMEPFLNHFHPTVSTFATSFIQRESDVVKPDLGLYTLSHFLDKFVYKNSKQKPVTKGSSIMQPLAGAHTGSLLVRASNKDPLGVPVNTQNWLERKAESVRPDEQFFYSYFSTKQNKIASSKYDKETDRLVKDEDQASDLEDDEVWNALVKSNPAVEDDEEMVDEDLSDFSMGDESDDESDDEELEVESLEDSEDLDDNSDDQEGELNVLPDSNSEISDEEEFAGFDAPQFENMSEDEEATLFKGDSEDEYSDDSDSRKRSANQEKAAKRQKLKNLPVFASAEDYAQYLDSDEE